jgi:PPOX class probable F420-dependent enzyme
MSPRGSNSSTGDREAREHAGMPDIAAVRSFLADEHGLVVVSTAQRDGGVLSSVVNAGVMADPVGGSESVAFVSAGGAARLGHIRRGSPVTATVRRGWKWVAVTGPAYIIGPDDPADDVDDERLRLLLREVFQAAGGRHDDYDEYDRVMRDERRAAVFVEPARILGNG